MSLSFLLAVLTSSVAAAPPDYGPVFGDRFPAPASSAAAPGYFLDAQPRNSPVPATAAADGALRRTAADVVAQGTAPDSRDAVFGATAAKKDEGAVRWSGFLQNTTAYTYADPVHWSRFVTRLAVDGAGNFGESVKWKIGARVDVDPVYYESNFYLQDVKKNQQLNAFWRENYVDFSAGSLDFRIGAQQIVWGEVVGIFVADIVGARDTREFLLPSFDLIRIPQWAVRAEYFKDDSHLELVWVPVQAFDRIGKPGADFYPVPLPSPTSSTVAGVFENPQSPARNLGNSSYGGRANTLVGGWDLAAFYYRSFANQPTFYRQASPGTPGGFLYQPLYDRIWQTGGTVSKDFRDVVLRGEVVYANGQNFASTDPTASQGVVSRQTLDYILGLTFTLPRDISLNVQGFQRVYFGGGQDAVALKTGTFGASALLSGKITDNIEPQLLWIQTFGGGGNLVRPRVNWNFAKNSTIGVGVDIFTGPTDGFFGRYNNRDRVYGEVRYDF